MPSKSRKKIKGQARKAKAKAAAANNSGLTNSLGRDGIIQTQPNMCYHANQPNMCNHEEAPDVCVQFIKWFFQFFLNNTLTLNTPGASVTLTVVTALETAYNKFPEAVNNESNREIIKNDFISTGASYLLERRRPDTSVIMSRSCATALMFIDSYSPSCPVPAGHLDDRDAKVWLRNLDIMNGCHRSLVKYFAKQTPCNCLDELYSQMKSTKPKMGHCFGCRQTKLEVHYTFVRVVRTSLFICTGCERSTYCSKACQIAHVPKHKDDCKYWHHYNS